MEYLDADLFGLLPIIPYLKDFVDYFVDQGYERDKTIRAAPYDWRLAAGVCIFCLHSYSYASLASYLQLRNSPESLTAVTEIT